MSLRSEMAARCRASASTPARGEVELTAEHLAAAPGATPEEKRRYLMSQACHGCCEGSGAFHAHARLVTRAVNGRTVELIEATAFDPT